MAKPHKIERINCKKRPSIKLANEMILWGKIMGHLRMVPHVAGKGWAGNIAFRENDAVWVTSAGCIIDNIKIGDIIGITEKDNKIVFWGYTDKKPTSEWEIHWGVFKKRHDINIILHGHDPLALETAEKLNEIYSNEVALTKRITEAGSPEFRDEMLEIATNTNSYLIGRNHGFFSLGKTFNDAGALALEFRSRSNELMMGKENYKKLLDKYNIG